MLLASYIARVAETLDGWLANLLVGEYVMQPLVTAEGRVWTPSAVDLFRILNEQVAVVLNATAGGLLLLHVGAEAERVMLSFQKSVRQKLLEGDLSLEQLCATANNNLRCHKLAEEFANRLNDSCMAAGVEGEQRMGGCRSVCPGQVLILINSPTVYPTGQLHLEETWNGFSHVAYDAISACAVATFSDPGIMQLFSQVACSQQWLEGGTSASIFATLKDYGHDLASWLEPALFQQLGQLLLSECVSHFLAAIMTQLRTIHEQEMHALRRDHANLAAFFATFVPPELAAHQCQPLGDVCEFLASDSTESFVLAYTTLLQSVPGLTPILLSNLLMARAASDAGMTKADTREVITGFAKDVAWSDGPLTDLPTSAQVLEACREVHASRTVQHPTDGSSGMQQTLWQAVAKSPQLPSSARHAAFHAALSGARTQTRYRAYVGSEGNGLGG